MSDQKMGYCAYLLRLWQADQTDTTVWRASLQSSGSEERHLFANLEQLFTFLEQEAERRSTRVLPGPVERQMESETSE